MKKTIGMGGFTLAEVLITLGIIGVVAAMTMPTLINSTQGAQYKTAFKKSLTVLSQAVVMNIALNDYDLSQVVNGTNATATADATGSQSLYDLFNNRLNIVRRASGADFQSQEVGNPDYWQIVQNTDKADYEAFTGDTPAAAGDDDDDDDTTGGATGGATGGGTGGGTASGNTWPDIAATGGKWPTATTMLFMNDGITFIFDNTQSDCHEADTGIGVADNNYCFGFIDVNGIKAPNRVVQCDGGFQGTPGDPSETCNVSNPTDIYPIAMFNQSVIPASAAARAVLYNK